MTAEEIYNLGILEFKKGETGKAVEHFQEAVRLNDQFYRAHAYLGMSFERLGDLDKAIAAYRHTIQIEPSYHKAHNNLGELLRHQGKFEEAVDSFEIACRLSRKSSNYLYNLGLAYRDIGNVDQAREAFERAYRLAPDDHEIVQELTTTLYNLKDIKGAVAILTEFVNKNDNHTRIFEFKMKLNALKKKVEKDAKK